MNNLTKRARHIIEFLAHSEGRRLNSDSLGPDHILLGIIKDSECTAMKILLGLGINIDTLKRNIEISIYRVTSNLSLNTIPVSSRFNRILEIANEESKKNKSGFTGTEHLLLALFKYNAMPSIVSLSRAGIDYNTIFEFYYKSTESSDIEDDNLKNKNKQSVLYEYTVDITKLASLGNIEPVIGRNTEIERMIHILCRKTKNNPVLIGEAGVGKTAIVEGLALRICKDDVPSFLRGKKIVSLDITGVVAGTKFRGDFEERMKKIVKEIRNDTSTILFIDEIHTIMGAGAAEGAIDASGILKPYLARGEIQCVGVTTIKEYKKYIEKDSAFDRRFQKIIIHETDYDQTVLILKGIVGRYEEHHRVKYSDDAIHSAVALSKRYIHDRCLPDKAIDCIDEAGSKARIISENKPEIIDNLEKEISVLKYEKEIAVSNQEFERASTLRDEIARIRLTIEEILTNWKNNSGDYSVVVDSSLIRQVIINWTGIHVADYTDDNEKYLSIETSLKKRIYGQEQAIVTVSKALRRNRSGIRKGTRPVASFLFVGPTGVGKTELAKVISDFLYNDDKSLIRIDMSEYSEKHAVARLIGSPPGYIGYDEGGQLTEKVRKHQNAVILFDEVEKAHIDFTNIMLQILEEGELTDGMGTRVSFRETIIIMTSNIGNTRFDKFGSIGFSENISSNDNTHNKIYNEIRKRFNPELINRIDEIVYFNALTASDIFDITENFIKDLIFRMKEKGITLTYDPEVISYIADKSYSPEWGARQVRRFIENNVEDLIACEILSSEKSIFENTHLIIDDGIKVLHKHQKRKKSKNKEKVDIVR